MQYYPIFLDITKSKCLIVGAGQVGMRKLATLLRAHAAKISLMDINPPNIECQKFLENPSIEYLQYAFKAQIVKDYALVFACTTNKDVNQAIIKACQEYGVLCNSIDTPLAGNFIVPASIHKENITLSLSTGGGSPALARKMRLELEEYIASKTLLAQLMKNIRPYLLNLKMDTAENTIIFRDLVNSELEQELNNNNREQCRKILQKILPNSLQSHILEIMHGII